MTEPLNPKMKLLLISNSTVHGQGYLQHCAAAIQEFLGEGTRTTFIPYALADHEGYAERARKTFAGWGRALDSVHQVTDPRQAVLEADSVFIGGGNTFRLLHSLYEKGLVDALRDRVARGMPYIGSSAGSNVACLTIGTTNDMPIVYPPSFEALRLAPFNLNPHYLDPDPHSKHMGETREERIEQFHEENPQPVIGLREGNWLWIENGVINLQGTTGARLFRRGMPAREIASPSRIDLSDLLV